MSMNGTMIASRADKALLKRIERLEAQVSLLLEGMRQLQTGFEALCDTVDRIDAEAKGNAVPIQINHGAPS